MFIMFFSQWRYGDWTLSQVRENEKRASYCWVSISVDLSVWMYFSCLFIGYSPCFEFPIFDYTDMWIYISHGVIYLLSSSQEEASYITPELNHSIFPIKWPGGRHYFGYAVVSMPRLPTQALYIYIITQFPANGLNSNTITGIILTYVAMTNLG